MELVAALERLEPRRLLSAPAAADTALLAGATPSASTTTAAAAATPPRLMENLGRGVVAVRAATNQVFVSWRLLGLDPAGIAFNVYRSANGAAAVKLNGAALTGGTNFSDTTANHTANNAYHVRPVIGGVEGAASASFNLTANHTVEPVVRIPLRDGGAIKFVWVGDLDGDGEYDYVIDRQTAPQKIEAYRSDGAFLWEVNMGPNSLNQNNIEGGSSTVDVGHNDGVTVYDLDSDGRAEVAVRIANGVTFGNGVTFSNANDNLQFIAILDGMTGAPRATAPVPTDYLSDGPMYARFGVGHLDGVNPSLVSYMKNRVGSGGFNLMFCAWDFDGSTLTRQWKFLRGNQDLPDGHQTRIVDVNGDGKDEIAEIGFVLNGNGTLRYSLGPAGIAHGDRFHVADIDPARPGLEGYGVQQNDNHLGEPNRILEYYYDAANGQILWTHLGTGADVGRGMAADIDPRFPGMEVWSFSGLYNGPTNQLTEPNTSLRPWPQLGFWWDGDLLHELLNNGKFEQWNWLSPTPTNSAPRLLTVGNYGGVGSGVNPLLYGDLLGDWREEAVYTNSTNNQLLIFTTPIASSHRIYTLAHNPAYRNGMTLKGYMQSHHLDYFLGDGMAPPPVPNIAYAGQAAPAGTVVGTVFHDADADNLFDPGEPVLSNVTVFLDADGDAVLDPSELSTTSDTTGAYAFAGVAPGAYTVRALAPVNYFATNAVPVTVTAGSSNTAQLAFARNVYTGTAAGDHYRVRRNLAGQYEILIDGALVYTVSSAVGSLAFNLLDGDDTLIVDAVNGSPAPAGGLAFNAGAGAADLLAVRGSAGPDLANFAASFIALNGKFVLPSAVERLTFDGAGGGDELTVASGAVALTATQKLAALSVNAPGLLDTRDHDLVIDYSSVSPLGVWTGDAYDGVTGWIRAGRVVSSLAVGVKHLAVAEAQDALNLSATATATWSGQSVDATAVLVKFTWGGDATLDGRINIDDYGRIDSNATKSGSVFGYARGDFNLDGRIDIDDYGLIDTAAAAQDEIL